MKISTALILASLVATSALGDSAASAKTSEQAIILNAPAKVAPSVKLAVQFDLNVRLPDGKGLARALLDAGVDREDAAMAARLAAGHLGDAQGGCQAKVSIQGAPSGAGFRLVRVQLSSQTDRMVIERRGSELTVASQSPGGALLYIA